MSFLWFFWPLSWNGWVIVSLLAFTFLVSPILYAISYHVNQRLSRSFYLPKNLGRLAWVRLRSAKRSLEDVALCLLLVSTSFWAAISSPTFEFPVTFAAIGVALFTVGLLALVRSALIEIFWRIGPYSDLKLQITEATEFIRCRHPIKAATIIAGIGLTVISGSALVILAGSTLLILVGAQIIRVADKKRFDDQSRRWGDDTGARMLPHWSRLAIIGSVSALTGLASAILLRELPVFYGALESAATLLAVIAQIQGTVGVLAITIGFVLTQVTSSTVSVRASGQFFHHPTIWVPIFALVFSISWDVFWLARISNELQSEAKSNLLWIDVGVLLAVVAAFAIGLLVRNAPRLITPEAIVEQALKKLNRKWIERVKRDWSELWHPSELSVNDDPIVIVERTLASALDRSDRATFHSIIILLIERLQRFVTPEEVVEVDKYLLSHLRVIINRAADLNHEGFLLPVLLVAQEIGDAEFSSKRDSIGRASEQPGGELLIRTLIDACVENRHANVAQRGMSEIVQRSQTIIENFPSPSDTSIFFRGDDSKWEILNRESQEQRTQRWANDRIIRGIYDQYLKFLETVAVASHKNNQPEISGSAVSGILTILVNVVSKVQDVPVKKFILGEGLSSLYKISQSACDYSIKQGFSGMMLQFFVEQLEPPMEDQLADDTAYYLKRILVEQAEAGILDWSVVLGIALAGLALAKKFPKAELELIEGMGQAAQKLKEHPQFETIRTLKPVYQELVSSIRQQRSSSAGENIGVIGEKVKEVLKELGESETNPRGGS